MKFEEILAIKDADRRNYEIFMAVFHSYIETLEEVQIKISALKKHMEDLCKISEVLFPISEEKKENQKEQ